jgi:hypothetical protein
MKTYWSILGVPFAYNDSANWMYDHQMSLWFVMTRDDFNPAVVDDFGNLVEVSWEVTI